MRLIDADAFIQRLREDCEDEATREFVAEIHDLVEIEAEFHPVDAEPIRHGKWIDEGQYADYHPHHAWRCSECGEHVIEIDTSWFKYCPNCGARMDASKYEELEINPCRGCEDYDGKGGCLSNGGCANVNEVEE